MIPAPVEAVLQYYPACFRPWDRGLPPDGPGFSGAIIVRLETAAGPYCLRGWPAEADAERIAGLHRLLQHARSRGIDFVAVPVPTSDGRTLVFYEGRGWQLEPWLPGRADFSSQPSPARLNAAAIALARLHVALASFKPAGSDSKWYGSQPRAIAPAVTERIERLESWNTEQLGNIQSLLDRSTETPPKLITVAKRIFHGFIRYAPRVSVELHGALHLAVPVQPCLRDVWHDHVLFTGDDVSGIVDAAAARADTVAADLSRLLGSLVSEDRRAWELALNAYQSIRPLSAEEQTLVDILDRSGVLLSGMTWLARRFLSNVQFEQPERVVARMEQIACRLESKIAKDSKNSSQRLFV